LISESAFDETGFKSDVDELEEMVLDDDDVEVCD